MKCNCKDPEVGVCMRRRKQASIWSRVNWGMVGDEIRVVAGFLGKEAGCA